MAGRILEATGVEGGLIVHLGCGDGELTAALCANDSYIVHGLDRDPENIDPATGDVQRHTFRRPRSVTVFHVSQTEER